MDHKAKERAKYRARRTNLDVAWIESIGLMPRYVMLSERLGTQVADQWARDTRRETVNKSSRWRDPETSHAEAFG